MCIVWGVLAYITTTNSGPKFLRILQEQTLEEWGRMFGSWSIYPYHLLVLVVRWLPRRETELDEELSLEESPPHQDSGICPLVFLEVGTDFNTESCKWTWWGQYFFTLFKSSDSGACIFRSKEEMTVADMHSLVYDMYNK